MSGWSVKIQHEGVRRTLSLQSATRDAAATEAAAIHNTILAKGWDAVRRAGGNSRVGTAVPNRAPGAALRPQTGVRYWKSRLVCRRHVGSSGELSVRVEHDGIGHFFPLGTADADDGARRAHEIHESVVRMGWEEACCRFAREVTIGFHWAADPLAWTYATLQTVPSDDEARCPPASNGPNSTAKTSPGVHIAIVESEPGLFHAVARCLRDPNPAVTRFAFAEEAIREIPRCRVHLVLLNHHLPEMTGEECAERLAVFTPQLPRIVYSAHEDSEELFKSTPGGASGYLLKRTPADRLLAPVHGLLTSGPLTTEGISDQVRKYFHAVAFALQSGEHHHAMSRLTRREKEILDFLSRGCFDKEIAGALGISAWTVHGHMKNIFEKLGVHSRIEAVLKYLQK